MARIILSISLFIMPFSFMAQSLFDVKVGLGLRFHFGGMKAIHHVTEYYNTNRPWLQNEMGTSTFMSGFEFGLENSGKKFGWSLAKVHYVWTTKKASGITPGGEDFTRKVRLSQVGVDWLDFWWTPLHLKNINFGFGIMPAGTAAINLSTKYNGGKTKISNSHHLGNDYFMGFLPLGHIYHAPHLDVTYVGGNGRALHLQLFYTIGPSQEYDLAYLNREINPKSYNDINKRTLLSVNNFGLKLMYNF